MSSLGRSSGRSGAVDASVRADLLAQAERLLQSGDGTFCVLFPIANHDQVYEIDIVLIIMLDVIFEFFL